MVNNFISKRFQAPPPAAIEFLMKIREVISIAKHKMTAKKFVPTLTGMRKDFVFLFVFSESLVLSGF